GFTRNIAFIFPEGSKVDYRVSGVVVDVGDGREVDVQPGTFHLSCDLSAHFINEVIVRDGAERHLIGEADGAIEPHAQSPFSVHGHQERYFGSRLVQVDLSRLSYRTALKKDQSSYLVVADDFQQFLLMILSAVRPGGNHDQLRDFFVGRKGGKHGIHPRIALQAGKGR